MFVPIVIGDSVEPGSAAYSTSGTYSFTVPNYNTLTVTVMGAGGGGFQYSPPWFSRSGYAGGQSSFNASVYGNGGSGGNGVNGYPTYAASGGASGGDTNTTGGGAAGGTGSGPTADPDYPGSYIYGQSGGRGGKAVKTYSVGGLTPGASVSVVVGAGGSSSVSYGGNGSVIITWS